MASALSCFRQVDHPLSESAFPMKLLQKPAFSDMVFLDTDFYNASLPAADYRVRPPYLSFHADIFRTQATPDLHLTGAIFQTGYPLPDLPRQTDSTDADSIMASQSKTLGNTIIRQHRPKGCSLQPAFHVCLLSPDVFPFETCLNLALYGFHQLHCFPLTCPLQRLPQTYFFCVLILHLSLRN